MLKPRGYIALDRKIFEHPVFRRRPERLVAWEWLIAAAAWKPEGRRGDYGVVHVERGQLVATERSLGTSWGWPKTNVRRFLLRLAREGMVVLAKTGPATGPATGPGIAYPVTVVTICNYEKFQAGAVRSRGAADRQPDQQPDQGMQETLPLQGLPGGQPANQLTKDFRGVENSGESGQARKRTKPAHGAKGRGMIWFDYGSEEWVIYARDYRDVRGAEKLPESRIGGYGNWFKLLGEASGPALAAGGGKRRVINE